MRHLIPLFAALLVLLPSCGGDAQSDGPSTAQAVGPVGQWQIDVKATFEATGKPYEPEKEKARAKQELEELEPIIEKAQAKLDELRKRMEKTKKASEKSDLKNQIEDGQEELGYDLEHRERLRVEMKEPYARRRAPRVEVREDGTYTVQYRGEHTGTWVADGDGFTFTDKTRDGEEVKEPSVYQGTLDGDRLTLSKKGRPILFNRVK